jgi:hypothetical protein
MATPWMEDIRNAGQLLIFAGGSVTAGGWAGTFTAMMAEWNREARRSSFGVTLAASTAAPGAAGAGGANVQMEAVNGQYSFVVNGVTVSGNLAGTATSAETKLVIREFNQRPPGGGAPVTVRRLENALILVPARPSTGSPRRVLGDGVKLCIAVHELVHAAGLSNAEHGQGDIFFGFPQLRAGRRPADDRLASDETVMPPIVFGAQTIARIRRNWS